jgi:hypothetical protein
MGRRIDENISLIYSELQQTDPGRIGGGGPTGQGPQADPEVVVSAWHAAGGTPDLVLHYYDAGAYGERAEFDRWLPGPRHVEK